MREAELLEKLVAFQSVNPPGNEEPLARWIAGWADKLGLKADLQAVAPSRANVIVSAGAKRPGVRTLVLNGHLDVVPADGAWNGDPFLIRQQNGRLYGRGTCDMKGAVACMLTAVEELLAEGFRWKGCLMLVFVCDEESDNLGTHHLLGTPFTADACVIGEPTHLEVCVAHRGVCRHRVIISGRSGHASDPSSGVNAVEIMGAFTQEIVKLNHRLQREPPHPILPQSTVTVTVIHGGNKHNIIPSLCEAVLDWRTLPHQDEPYVRAALSEILERIKRRTARFTYELKTIIASEAGSLDADSDLALTALDVSRQVMGDNPSAVSFPACGEQALFLRSQIPTLFFGPGDIEQAHTSHEYVDICQLTLATAWYKEMIRKILG